MSLTAAAIRLLADKGLSASDIADIAEANDVAAETVSSSIAAKRERDRARMAAKREMERQSRDVASDSRSDTPLSLPLPPQTPLTPTHTPGDITTRARETADFAAFWVAYPRKVGKGDARKAFGKAVGKIGPDARQVLSGALERAKASWTDAQYIPHPATWLNRESWEDEPMVIDIQPRKANGPNHHSRPSDRDQRLGDCFEGLVAAVNERR